MNVTMNVECTPEEARRFMGLPDLTTVHDAYLDKVKDAITNGISPDSVETLMKSWSPMGEASMTFWRQLFEQMNGRQGK